MKKIMKQRKPPKIILTVAQWEKFIADLEKRPNPNPKLVRLLKGMSVFEGGFGRCECCEGTTGRAGAG